MDNSNPAPKKRTASGALVILAVILTFVALTWGLRALRPATGTLDQQRAQERTEIRDTTVAKSNDLVTTAAWVDKEKGIARIPVSDAMGLAVAQLASKQVSASAVALPSPLPQPSPSDVGGQGADAQPTPPATPAPPSAGAGDAGPSTAASPTPEAGTSGTGSLTPPTGTSAPAAPSPNAAP